MSVLAVRAGTWAPVLPVTAISAPALRAVQTCRPGRVEASYATTVSVRYGRWLVSLTDRPVALACQAQVSSTALARLRSRPVDSDVELAVDDADVMATRLTVHGYASGFAAPPSWFDTADGTRFGRPRLAAAAAALAGDLDASGLLGLVGLGIGLTPSGDDALVGMIAVATAAGVGSGTLRRFAGLLDDTLTTPASLTYLRLAMDGDFSAPVRHLLAALTRPGTPGLATAVAELSTMGHTSGADLMAGTASLATALGPVRGSR